MAAKPKGGIVRDPEMVVIGKIAKMLDSLDSPAVAARVVRYLSERYLPAHPEE